MCISFEYLNDGCLNLNSSTPLHMLLLYRGMSLSQDLGTFRKGTRCFAFNILVTRPHSKNYLRCKRCVLGFFEKLHNTSYLVKLFYTRNTVIIQFEDRISKHNFCPDLLKRLGPGCNISVKKSFPYIYICL